MLAVLRVEAKGKIVMEVWEMLRAWVFAIAIQRMEGVYLF
jgi:hypothetical protein